MFIVDQTIRDGPQSLWGHAVSWEVIFPVAELMDKIGFKAIGIPGPRGALIRARLLKENPFEKFSLLMEKIRNTPLRTSVSPWDFAGFNVGPLSLIELWIKRLMAHGIKSFWICEYQNMQHREKHIYKTIKEGGGEVVGGLMYTKSPVHTEEVWARKIRIMVEMGVDVIQVEDTVGVMTPDDVRKLVKILEREAKGIPVEFHFHCCTGIAPLSYVEGLNNNISIFHTCAQPLANSWSLPSTEQTIKNAKFLGFSVSIDEKALKQISEYFQKIAIERGLPTGTPVECDITPWWHHIPGGMRGTLKNQLAELKQEHRLEEVLEEAGRVRKDLGYPVGATPFSQMIGAQAFFNVVTGERYKVVSDEVVRYVLGHYGEPDGPIDPEVREKILKSPKAQKWINWKEPELSLEEIKELAPNLSEDDLLMELMEPTSELRRKVDEMYYKKGVEGR